MTSKRKSIVAGALAIASAGVWLPQIFGGGSGAPPPQREEVQADAAPTWGAEGGDQAFQGAFAQDPGQGDGIQGTTLPDAPIEDPVSMLEDLESTLEMVESFVPPTASELSLLARAAGSEVGDRGDGGWPVVPTNEDPRLVLDEFVEANPFTGLIHGDDRALALLGHRVVRAGERLDGGRIAVSEIGSGWVRLACEGQELVLDLPPFVARARAVAQGEEGTAAGAEAGATEGAQ